MHLTDEETNDCIYDEQLILGISMIVSTTYYICTLDNLEDIDVHKDNDFSPSIHFLLYLLIHSPWPIVSYNIDTREGDWKWAIKL